MSVITGAGKLEQLRALSLPLNGRIRLICRCRDIHDVRQPGIDTHTHTHTHTQTPSSLSLDLARMFENECRCSKQVWVSQKARRSVCRRSILILKLMIHSRPEKQRLGMRCPIAPRRVVQMLWSFSPPQAPSLPLPFQRGLANMSSLYSILDFSAGLLCTGYHL